MHIGLQIANAHDRQHRHSSLLHVSDVLATSLGLCNARRVHLRVQDVGCACDAASDHAASGGPIWRVPRHRPSRSLPGSNSAGPPDEPRVSSWSVLDLAAKCSLLLEDPLDQEFAAGLYGAVPGSFAQLAQKTTTDHPRTARHYTHRHASCSTRNGSLNNPSFHFRSEGKKTIIAGS